MVPTREKHGYPVLGGRGAGKTCTCRAICILRRCLGYNKTTLNLIGEMVIRITSDVASHSSLVFADPAAHVGKPSRNAVSWYNLPKKN